MGCNVAKIKILLVEDENIEAMDIKNALESFGYEVPYIASRGSEAVEKASEIMPDLILMDIILKGDTDGIDAASKIKELDIPVIYLTAHSEESTVKRAMVTEPYGYIIKPYDHNELKYDIELAIYKNQMEKQLKESEKKYRAMVDQAADALFVLDFKGNFQDVNRQACESLGYSREELLQMSVTDIEMDFDMESAWKEWEKVKPVQPFTLYGHHQRKDKTVFPVEVSFARVDIYNQPMIMGLARDITQRIVAEETIKRSEDKHRTLFNTMIQGVLYQDADGHITSMNPAAEKIMSYTPEEGQSYKHILKAIHEDGTDFPEETHPSMVALKTGQEIKNVVMGVKNPNKEEYTWLKVHAVPQFRSKEKTPYQVYTTFEDITYRKNTEKALKISENKYRALFDNAEDGILLMRKDHFIECNQKALDIYRATSEQIIGETPVKFSPEVQPDGEKSENKAIELINKALDGYPQHFEWKHLHYDGTPFYAEVTLNRLKIEDEYLIQAIVRDVTEREEAKRVLRESEQRLTDIIDFLPDATFAIDHAGKVIAWNKAVEMMTDTRKEDMIGKGDFIYAIPLYGERRPILIDLIKEENSKFVSKYEYVHKQGNALYAEVFLPSVYGGRGAYVWTTASPLLNQKGEQYGAIESVRDITERKKGEISLRKSEERFRAVAESAIDAIVTTDANGKIIFFNKSLTNIFGYSKEELNGKPLTILMPTRFKKGYLNKLQTFNQSGKHRLIGKTVTTIGLKKDKTEFPFEMSLSAWKSEGKIYFTSIIRDLSERQKANEKIKKSLEEKELLMQEIHHRVKNNMQIISSLLNLQTQYVDGEAVNVLKESQNRVKAMAMIHEKLYQSSDLSTINIADYIQSMIRDLFYFYDIKKEVITYNMDISDIRFNIETAVPCGLIISEIVSNSLKYAFPDGNKGQLSVSLKSNNDKYELIISDDGVGIPDELDYKNTESLGLQLVNNLVNQLDGEITLERSHGTKFKIIFKELEYKERF